MFVPTVSQKTIFFVVRVEKIKEMSLKSIILSTKFCLFYTSHMTRLSFMKRLCEDVASEDVRVNFFFK